ncbi:unnamed protein product [Albugo candida]|uniref:Uncharacterized protein n=1 Tax=Albugo candida TaxID=65357 RepID=A0A024GUY4_9STRA|nr:unnamed protein product [Albugo candida]|eukprot:CCI50802.1 unnamed protein product [Albugo candida]
MNREREELILRLIEKSSTFDKDERYMATSDLCSELTKGSAPLGAHLETNYFEPIE